MIFYFQKLDIGSRFPDFSKIVKLVCILFYGQAEVDQGFSQNKSSMRTNMLENSIVIKRLIKSHLKCNELTASNILISKDLLQSVKASSSRYKLFLESKKNENKKSRKTISIWARKKWMLKERTVFKWYSKSFKWWLWQVFNGNLQYCSWYIKIKKDAGTALQSKHNERKGKWAVAWNKGDQKNNWDIK